MPAIRHIKIENFRGISSLEWAPHPGFNAIIGPGDSGKSTVLDAIDLVLGSRRGSFVDSDFYEGKTENPIVIDITLGDLPAVLLSLESYSSALRGWCSVDEDLVDEPTDGREPVLTLRLTVNEDCEPSWCLYSERLSASDLPRDMRAEHRLYLMAQRLGANATQHLTWGARSVLTRLSEGADGSASVLASAMRAARAQFDTSDLSSLQPTADFASEVAREMAVVDAQGAIPALDARTVNVSAGAVALHTASKVPLRALGTGSTRLLVAGLQAKAASKVPVLLMDEVEHGLEPHRISRLLHQLGSKTKPPPQQVLLTTHSPVVLRELSAGQIWISRRAPIGRLVLDALDASGVEQGLIRDYPEAFLSKSVLVCEGATEVGLVRGIDLFRTARGKESLALLGVSLVDGKGIPKAYGKAIAFAKLGFRVALLRDGDKDEPSEEASLLGLGATVISWANGRATENELCESLPLDAVKALLSLADSLHGEATVNVSLSAIGLNKEGIAGLRTGFADLHRNPLARAARTGSWFKRIDFAEEVGRAILAPNIKGSAASLQKAIVDLARWTGQLVSATK